MAISPANTQSLSSQMPLSGGVVLAMAVLLACAGLVMVGSASFDYADRNYHNPFYFLQRHGVYMVAAFIVAAMVYQMSMSTWQKMGALLLLVSYVLLLVVLLPGIGKTVKGSTRWISLGVITVQVSEIAKICVLVYVSSYLVRRREEVQATFWGFMKPVVILSLMVLLLLLEPDFGAVVVIMTSVFFMLFLAGVKFSQFAFVVVGSLCAAAALVFSSEYRLRRLTGYIDPWADQYDAGYQLVQSLIAFGRGDMFGVGLGNSIQKLFYLPEAHTDFVFAIWAEEMGLVGALFIIAAYLLLVIGALRIGRFAEKRGELFSGYLAYGFGVMIGLQAFINIGVSSGLLPTKGLTLPLVSYGGSSLIINAMIIAILMRIHRENCVAMQRPTVEKDKAKKKKPRKAFDESAGGQFA